MATTEIDAAQAEEFAGRTVQILNDAMLALLLSVGHQTRLFDTMAGLAPSTSGEIARPPASTSATCASGSPG